MPHEVVLVTGASGYIGGAVTRRLIGRTEVRSLTSHPAIDRFDGRVRPYPYDFDQPARMKEAFQGVGVFVNTFYVRFNHGHWTFDRAVRVTRELISLAQRAGVRKVVHVSVSNAREASPLPYYRNKSRIEEVIRESGLDFTILRPALVVGPGDILVNNIAYFLRRLPVFTMFGRGRCRVQPIMLDALADLAVEAADGAYAQRTLAVAGPRDWTFLEMVRTIRAAVRSRAIILPVPTAVAFAGLRAAGWLLRDVVLTRDEIEGLIDEYLYADAPVRRGGDFSGWLASPGVATSLGTSYASELQRHFHQPA
jgi:NADH dehydrogenase